MKAKKKILGIGLMSGTSADGVDSALLEFEKEKIKLLDTGYIPYPPDIRKEVLEAFGPKATVDLVCRLNAGLGKVFGMAALKLMRKNGIKPGKLDFIGSHGQTVRHLPSKKGMSSTLQIGDGAEIALKTGSLVVSDFRTADIAAGGEGAPLAPLAHYLMFSDKKEDRIVHNLGGISNITWLKAGGRIQDVTGFDTGPANMLLDLAARRFLRADYDRDGIAALKGKVGRKLFSLCMAHPFFKKMPPKSTGREMFGEEYFKAVLKKAGGVGKNDLLRTLCAVSAESAIRQGFTFFGPKKKLRWIVCGGGAHNPALMLELKERLGSRGVVAGTSSFGFPERSVEAVLMAVLAYRTFNGFFGNLPTVTGAREYAVLGKLSFPPNHA